MSVPTQIANETAGVQSEQAIDELTPHGGYRSVLGNPSFLALWVGQVLSQLADRIIFVLFITLIVHHFGPSDRYSSYLYVAFTIPAILLTAIAGVFVDRWPRRAVLVTTNLMRACVVAALPWVASLGGGWTLYLMAFLISAATQFFVPAEAATIPMIVKKSDLLTANSLFTTTMMASVIFGFALGDPLINIFSLSQVHWAISGLFLAASLALMFVKPAPACLLEDGHQISPTLKGAFHRFLDEIQDGFAYIWQHRLVLHGMLKLSLLFSTMVALGILFISFAKGYLFEDPMVAAQKFAYIIAFSGVGMALGACWVGHSFRNSRRSHMVFSGFMVVGACLLLLTGISYISKHDYVFKIPAFASDFVYLDAVRFTMRMLYTYTVSVVMGMGAAFIAIPLQAMLHELIPEDKRGKVLGVQFTMLSTCSTLPVLLAGLLVEEVGVLRMFLLIGLPLLLFGLTGLAKHWKTGHVPAANW